MRSALGCLLAVALGGCYASGTLGRARVVDPGRLEVYGAPEAFVVATSSGASVRPMGEVGVRYGLVRDVELGARLTTVGLTLGTRLQLLRSDDPTSGLDVLIAPALAYVAQDKLAVELPVSFGLNLGEHQLVLAPRLTYQMRLGVPSAPGPVSFFYLGGSVGVALRLDDHVSLMPEITFLGQVYADPGYATNLAGAVGITGALGLLVTP